MAAFSTYPVDAFIEVVNRITVISVFQASSFDPAGEEKEKEEEALNREGNV